MNLTSLLYVSTSNLPSSATEEAVAAIVATAARHNGRHGLTGALLFTGAHFAQVLEGPESEIDRLMARVETDTRHANVMVVDRSPLKARRFGDWGMAYMGPSQFVARHISRLLHVPSESEKVRAAHWLADLMHEFSKN